MTDPIFSFQDYLNGMSSASERLADANALHGYDPVLRDSADKPLELGAASVNAIAHALTSAYLAYDHSPTEAAALGLARELKSYFGRQPPEAWDTFKDLYNNQVGRNIAGYAKKNGLSREQIQDLILDALSSGRLIATRQDPRIASSFKGNPLKFTPPSGTAAPWAAPSPGFSDFAATITRVPVPPAAAPRVHSAPGKRGAVDPGDGRPGHTYAQQGDDASSYGRLVGTGLAGSRPLDADAGSSGGRPGLIASIGGRDPSDPSRFQAPAGGLLSLIQEYMRNQTEASGQR